MKKNGHKFDVEAAAQAYALKPETLAAIPEDMCTEMAREVVNCVMTAFNTQKPCAKAFSTKSGSLRVEMRAESNRTPNTTLNDSIKFQLFVFPKSEPVFFP